ncbi:MAG: hypothetical protein JWN93_1274 [Hyphomicrobiales bacterium]|nr:hypothetical protein [Hyphomicrobiales bacterium]
MRNPFSLVIQASLVLALATGAFFFLHKSPATKDAFAAGIKSPHALMGDGANLSIVSWDAY